MATATEEKLKLGEQLAGDAKLGGYYIFTPPERAGGYLMRKGWYGTRSLDQFNDSQVDGQVIRINPKSVTVKAVTEGEWNYGHIYRVPKDAKATKDLTELMHKHVKSFKPVEVKGVSPKPSTEVKEPWKMTKDEYAKNAADAWEKFETPLYKKADYVGMAKTSHFDAVAKAKEQGKPVPAEVLKDYPELGKKEEKPKKPVWEMTKKEAMGDPHYVSAIIHRYEVQRAITQGKKVSQKVLRDYPQFLTKSEVVSMAKQEAKDRHYLDPDSYVKNALLWHRLGIANAVNEGQNVSKKILADYPDLTEPKAEPTKPEPKAEGKGKEQPINDTWKLNRHLARRVLTSANMDLHRKAIEQALALGLKPYKGWQKDYPELAKPKTKPKPLKEKAEAKPTGGIAQAVRDWLKGKAYIDNQGNYHVRAEGSSSGPVASWNKEAKAKFKSPSELHQYATKGRARVGIKSIDNTQAMRSSRALAIDNALLAKRVVTIDNADVWRKNPNRVDIRGIDTPGSGRIRAGVAYADKGQKRLARKHHKGWRKIKFT